MRTYLIQVTNQNQIDKIAKYFSKLKINKKTESIKDNLLKWNKCCLSISDDIKYVDKLNIPEDTKVIKYESWVRRRNYDKTKKKSGLDKSTLIKKCKQDELVESFELVTKTTNYKCCYNQSLKEWEINAMNKLDNNIITMNLNNRFDKNRLIKILRKLDKQLFR